MNEMKRRTTESNKKNTRLNSNRKQSNNSAVSKHRRTTMKGRGFVSVLPAAIGEAVRIEVTTLGRLLAITVGIILLFFTPCAAQEGIPTKVDEYVKAEMHKQR